MDIPNGTPTGPTLTKKENVSKNFLFGFPKMSRTWLKTCLTDSVSGHQLRAPAQDIWVMRSHCDLWRLDSVERQPKDCENRITLESCVHTPLSRLFYTFVGLLELTFQQNQVGQNLTPCVAAMHRHAFLRPNSKVLRGIESHRSAEFLPLQHLVNGVQREKYLWKGPLWRKVPEKENPDEADPATLAPCLHLLHRVAWQSLSSRHGSPPYSTPASRLIAS